MILAACRREKPLFVLMEAAQTGVTFTNQITENDSINVLDFEYMYNGGGVGIGDFNNDGRPDLFFTGNQVPCELYLNKGNFKFENITRAAGIATPYWCTGVAVVDINQDGLLDIYVSTIYPGTGRHAPNLLFVNQGLNPQQTPVFKEMAQAVGLNDTGYSTQAAFLDYDRDGDLDAYLLTNALEDFNRNLPIGQRTNGTGRSTDRLYRNEGPQANGLPQFTNVSQAAGITTEGWGLGVAVADINHDGWPDIYCANDFQSNDLLWINNQNGTFTNRIAAGLKHQSANSMGTDIADLNNDGLPEIMTLDMMPDDNLRQKTMFGAPNYDRYELNTTKGYQPQFVRNVLQLNNGPATNSNLPTFSDIGQLAGIYATDWSWSALLADFDNDGFRDVFITNGYPKDITDLDFAVYQSGQQEFTLNNNEGPDPRAVAAKINGLQGVQKPNFLYRNTGRLIFDDVSEKWGINLPSYSNGAAYADLDNDGDLDLVVNNINDQAFLFRNTVNELKTASSNHYLRLHLTGPPGNNGGFGAKIEIRYGGKKQFIEHSPYRGYVSTVEPTLHFGLGPVKQVDQVRVTWPDGKISAFTNVPANQLVTVNYRQATPAKKPLNKPVTPLFEEYTAASGIQYVHQENAYVDFKNQVLLPQQYSRLGPGMATGDVDGNGLDDVFIGGALGKIGQLMRQTAPGKFAAKPLVTTSLFKREEDTGALFFDADGDQDLDLYVVSGGNEFPENSEFYQDRLYRNDGRGNFALHPAALPTTRASGSCVTAADFDADGDLDLFVGGRVRPRQYPLPAPSYLLRNDKGIFTEVTEQVAPGLKNNGLVTAALWTDFNDDGRVDLLVAGEFMPLTFWQNHNGKFKNVTAATGLPNTAGWWNSLNGGDFDNDGDLDYLAGNLGLNSRFKASEKEPVCVYAKDYDGNGNLDPILCRYIQGQEYISHPRDQLTDQIPALRKRLVTYAAYGKQTLADIFPAADRQDAYVARSVWFASSFLQNQGHGKFTIQPLPTLSQVAPVFSILINDYTGDDHLDALLVGNLYATDVLNGRYDAFPGQLLQGDGKGHFTTVPRRYSGFTADKDAKSLIELAAGPHQSLSLVASNNDTLRVFKNPVWPAQQEIKIQPADFSALVPLPNGRRRKVEFYHGAGYLSQSSRLLKANVAAGVPVQVTDYQNRTRAVYPDKNERPR